MSDPSDELRPSEALAPAEPSRLEKAAAEIERLDRLEAIRQLDAAEAKASRHLVWAALGLSPAALIPFVGFLLEGSWSLVLALLVLVFVIEIGRYALARREVERLEEVLRRMRNPESDPFEDTTEEVTG